MSQKFGTRREQTKGETRRIILETAHRLFEEVGYEKTTMRALAARAGVGIGTIFQHFKNKSALLVATFDESMRPVVENAVATIPPTGLKGQLRHLIRHVFDFYSRRSRLSRVLLREIIFMEGDGADRIKQLEKEYIETMSGIFKEAVDRGEIKKSVSITDAVTAFWAYYSHTLLGALNAEAFDINRQLEQMDRLVDQLLIGIGVATE